MDIYGACCPAAASAAAWICNRYYDAGDFVKFNMPQAVAMTLLAWGVLEFKEV